MQWLKSVLMMPRAQPPASQADREAFQRRAAELRERHERLERLAVESDVISRTDSAEDEPWQT